MGFTLDELLNETGVNNLGARHTKTAAPAKPDFSKLAARCRRAAEASPADQVAAGNATLAEKVASVEIIRRTMAEIAAIDGGQTKTAAPAAPTVDTAAFIKVALEAGHSPEAIAEFLEKAAAPGGIRRFWSITVPMLGPTLLFVMIVSSTRVFQAYGEIDLLTGGGPQPTNPTTTIPYFIYGQNSPIRNDAGLQAGAAVLLFVMLLVLSGLQLAGIGRRVHYGD